MKNAIILVGMITMMISCSKNQSCRNEIFGSNVWRCNTPGVDMMMFGADDNLSYTVSNNSQIYQSKFDFNDDCSGFTFVHNSTTLNMDITKVLDDTVYIHNNVTMNIHVYYKSQ